jgi:hypothetical protein
VSSPRRRARREAATITIESDTDTSIEEIDMIDFQDGPAARRKANANAGRQVDIVAGILWPLRTILSLTISIFHALVSPLLLQILLPVIGVVLAIVVFGIVARFGFPFLVRNLLSLAQAPFKLAWNLYLGNLHLGDITVVDTLRSIRNGIPSSKAVTHGICSIAPVPLLCSVGIFEKMRAVQEEDRAIVARKLQKEGT